jgi:hypothetical protein
LKKVYIFLCLTILIAGFDKTADASSLEFGLAEYAYNGHLFGIYKAERDITWQDAETAAQGLGGYLATLLTPEEDRFVLDAFRGSVVLIGLRAWIGLSDYDEEGVFKWVTGPEGIQPLTYDHWLPGDPNNGNDEDYVEWRNEPVPPYYGSNLSWNNVPPDAVGLSRFMVEFDPSPVPVPATLFLLSSGLIGIAGFGRKKFRKS